MNDINRKIADELDEQATLFDERAESLGPVPPDTSASGSVIALREAAQDLRCRAIDLREGR